MPFRIIDYLSKQTKTQILILPLTTIKIIKLFTGFAFIFLYSVIWIIQVFHFLQNIPKNILKNQTLGKTFQTKVI